MRVHVTKLQQLTLGIRFAFMPIWLMDQTYGLF
jgi:hypothetical protein